MTNEPEPIVPVVFGLDWAEEGGAVDYTFWIPPRHFRDRWPCAASDRLIPDSDPSIRILRTWAMAKPVGVLKALYRCSGSAWPDIRGNVTQVGRRISTAGQSIWKTGDPWPFEPSAVLGEVVRILSSEIDSDEEMHFSYCRDERGFRTAAFSVQRIGKMMGYQTVVDRELTDAAEIARLVQARRTP